MAQIHKTYELDVNLINQLIGTAASDHNHNHIVSRIIQQFKIKYPELVNENIPLQMLDNGGIQMSDPNWMVGADVSKKTLVIMKNV